MTDTTDEDETQSGSAISRVPLRDVEWAAEPDFTGSEFLNTMKNPQAQILIERERFGGRWLMSIADSNGMIATGKAWQDSRGKSLREAVEHAVEIVRASAG